MHLREILCDIDKIEKVKALRYKNNTLQRWNTVKQVDTIYDNII